MKSIITAGALLLCSTFAHAQSANWTFSYTGFYDRESAVFLPDVQLQGSFSGSDANANGVLERAELTSLLIGSKNYVACAGDSNAYYHCGADSFTFSSGGSLAFSLGEYGSDPEGWVGGGHTVTTGDSDASWNYNPASFNEHHLDWTSATQLSLTNHTELADAGIGVIQLGQIPAVPEASTWSMLLGGLGALGGLQALRRKGKPRA
jgi:hypothetical protein